MLKTPILGESATLYSTDPIHRLTAQTFVVFLHLGDEVLEPFRLPRPHAIVGGLERVRLRGPAG